MTHDESHLITPEAAKTLSGLFAQRVQKTPDTLAYKSYNEASGMWEELTWSEAGKQAGRWQAALASENLEAGSRVAVMAQNCPQWVMFDQAAHDNGMVLVPLYTQDRSENVAYILENAGVEVLLIGTQEHWDTLQPVWDQLGFLKKVISLVPINTQVQQDTRLVTADEWLPQSSTFSAGTSDPDSLATIVYTSGTTGKPKGVMLSHHNILWNAYRSLTMVHCSGSDIFLSFLPLSHTLERSAGYYLPMMVGSAVAYNRSIPQLAEDLVVVKPTVLISVPRIFERIYNKIQTGLEEKSGVAKFLFNSAVNVGWHRFEYQQHRTSWHPKLLFWPLLFKLVGGKVMEKLGGNMRVAIIGGAPLPTPIAKMFIGLGLPMLQGYGLTETSPVLSVNRLEDNDPASVGCILEDAELRIGNNDELLAKSPGVMLGYWKNEQATNDMIDADGWLHTGDKAKIENGHVYITGRIKEILVLANGEKVPPADMEMAICLDGLFEQAMVIGDSRAFLTALLVLEPEKWNALTTTLGISTDDYNCKNANKAILQRISTQISSFPGYAKIRNVHCVVEPWSIEDGLITPTLKLRRNKVCEHFKTEIEKMYKNH